jgi:hypothetical protein
LPCSTFDAAFAAFALVCFGFVFAILASSSLGIDPSSSRPAPSWNRATPVLNGPNARRSSLRTLAGPPVELSCLTSPLPTRCN